MICPPLVLFRSAASEPLRKIADKVPGSRDKLYLDSLERAPHTTALARDYLRS